MVSNYVYHSKSRMGYDITGKTTSTNYYLVREGGENLGDYGHQS